MTNELPSRGYKPHTTHKRIPLLRPRVETSFSWRAPDGAPSTSDRSLSLPIYVQSGHQRRFLASPWAVEAPEPTRNPTVRRAAEIRLHGGLLKGLK